MGNIYVNSIGDALITVVDDLALYTSVYNPGEGLDANAGDIIVSTEQFGSLFVGGDVILNADALGGYTETSGINSGVGRGGDIYLQATDGGSINILGNVTATAIGQGGEVYSGGSAGGDGFGGFVGILTIGDITLADLNATGGSMNIGGNVYIDVSGYGADGSGIECFSCNGLSGNGEGGTSWLFAQAGIESMLTVQGSVQMYALGSGGDSIDQVAGAQLP